MNHRIETVRTAALRGLSSWPNAAPAEKLLSVAENADGKQRILAIQGILRLIERDTSRDPSNNFGHAAALDLGLANCNTEFFVSLHTDTIIHRNGWLTELVGHFVKDIDKIACVGSGKIEMTPKWQILVKQATDFKTFWRRLLQEPDPLGKFRYYNRTICCLYKTNILRRERLTFLMGRDKGLTSGKKLPVLPEYQHCMLSTALSTASCSAAFSLFSAAFALTPFSFDS